MVGLNVHWPIRVRRKVMLASLEGRRIVGNIVPKLHLFAQSQQ